MSSTYDRKSGIATISKKPICTHMMLQRTPYFVMLYLQPASCLQHVWALESSDMDGDKIVEHAPASICIHPECSAGPA